MWAVARMMSPVTMLLLPLLCDFTLAFQPSLLDSAAVRASLSLGAAAGNSNNNNDEDFMRWARQSRSAGVTDNKVDLLRPLGLILKEDERGNVYVDTVAPKGNAARTGKVCATGNADRDGLQFCTLCIEPVFRHDCLYHQTSCQSDRAVFCIGFKLIVPRLCSADNLMAVFVHYFPH